MSPWTTLFLAGVFEVLFALFLRLSDGFTKWPYYLPFALCAICSLALLSQALKGIPLGTAYAVWTGLGAFGTVIVGMVFFKEPVSPTRIAFLVTLIASAIGLKVTG